MSNFSLSEGRRVAGNYAVYPNSLLFQAGNYPDKNLTMTPADIAAAAAGFVPTEFNVEHAKHGAHQALAGAFGGVLKAWVDTNNPRDLRGEVAIPLWLDSRLETKAPSLEFDIASKQICGAALTYTPRVTEAAFMSAVADFAVSPVSNAAFASTRHDTPDGQITMQNIHDTAARAGAICDKKNAAQMSSQHEVTGFQKIHDEASKHGADCASGDAPAWAKSMFSLIHSADASAATQPTRGVKTMSEKLPWYSRLIPSLKTAGVSEADIHASFAEMPAFSTGLSDNERAEFAVLKADNAALKAQSARIEKERIGAAAAAFADAAVREGRAFPAERQALVAAFSQAAEDDAALPKTVTFSRFVDGEEAVSGTRTDALTAVIANRPQHNLHREMVEGTTYFSLGATKPKSKDDELNALDAEVRVWGAKQNKTGQSKTGVNASGEKG